jgi:DNA polymerase IV
MDDHHQSRQTSPARHLFPNTLDLSSIPPILLLSAHFKDNEEHEIEEQLYQYGAPLTSDVSEVKVFIGKVGTKRRAEFELRARKLRVEEAILGKRLPSPVKQAEPPNKRRKLDSRSSKAIMIYDEGSTTEEESNNGSETEDELPTTVRDTPTTSPIPPPEEDPFLDMPPIFESRVDDDIIWVVNLTWLDDCIAAGRLVPLLDHLVYRGRVIQRPERPKTNIRDIKPYFSTSASKTALISKIVRDLRPETGQGILERAKEDAETAPKISSYKRKQPPGLHHGSHRFEGKTFSSSSNQVGQRTSQMAHLLQQTTSEYEGVDSEIPIPPEWVSKGLKYACQRFTPANGPNEDFIEQLKKIRTARTLTDDDIGVRAYSSIIASIAAYPHKLSHPRELLRLPGCDTKVANLWVEWKNAGKIQAVEDFENDEAMKVLRTLYNIWGVGAKTARNLYYNNHWTELDDIIEFGWNDLDRVQQIGLKYYDEFLNPIPRPEVDQIANKVREHAVRLRGDRVTVTIVGGYRRGKAASGDVDLIVSHPDLEATAGLVGEIIESLEETGWITHTLLMSLNNTNREQGTLPFRTAKASGAGFDTLDKALVVWQDPHWPDQEEALAENPKAKNPNIHRRVDIIISPWRTVGCAVMGWSGGTTFQRDLRRYAKAVKGWKFDSSGIRSRVTGEVIQIEGPNGVDGTPEDAERKVFEGLGLEYVPPEQRCTN